MRTSGTDTDWVRATVQIVLSLIVSVAAVYVILADSYTEGTTKWAYGVLGLILGYWLR